MMASKASEDPQDDLICDAVQHDAQASGSGFRGCLQSCCPLVISAINDLRKVKVAEVVSKKANSLSVAVANPGDLTTVINAPDPELDTVIEKSDDIIKPHQDAHQYRYLELRNGLKVLLASDPQLKSSAAALDIKIGSFHDPVHLQGLAHLCEHVLFTGSEIYPNESYSAFLGQRGGSSNAFTTSEHTNFHFEVPSDHFVEALKRFVSFFQCPILREVSIQNELEIVQSEHEKNKYNDVWRTNQVERATANPAHVFSHFSTGTRQTLTVEKGAERSLRYELFQFYRSNYSANIMCLCLVHNQSLDEMEDLVKAHLLGLLNKNLPERIWPSKPFKSKQMRTKIFVVPVKEVCHVNLTFPLEDLSCHYASGPAGQVCQLIGHKGQGSLYSYLRSQGWAHQLVACHRTLGKGFSLLMVSIQLTESGEKCTDEVINLVFQYIQLLKETGPLQWFYEELAFLAEQQFQTADKERPQNFASNAALWLHMYPKEQVLRGDTCFDSWRPDLVERVYAYLSPDNVRVTILTKKAKFFATHVEPHFGTEYHVEKIDAAVLAKWHACGLHPDLKVPRPNDLIDKTQEVLLQEDSKTMMGLEEMMPELLFNMERIRFRAWHMPNTKMKIPKAFTFLKFYSTSKPTVKMSCLNSLLAFAIRDCLSQVSYKAQLAGLFYVLRPTSDGLELEVRGFSGKQPLFLEKILAVLFDVKAVLTAERFATVHSLYLNGLASGEASKLKILAKNILSHVLTPDNYLRENRLKVMSEIKLEELQGHAKDLFVKHSLESFFYGNLSVTTANKMANSIILARRDFLECYIAEEFDQQEIQDKDNMVLEEWFKNDPVNQIAKLESDIEQYTLIRDKCSQKVINNKLCQDQDLPADNSVIDSENEGSGDIKEPAEIPQEPANEELEDLEKDYGLKKSEDKNHVIIVNNEIHSSSCVLYFLEVSKTTISEASKLELFFHLVQVKLITAMKHVVPLGYVVGCDIRKVNGRLGFRITVESQYPLSIVHKTIEDALEDIDDFLAKMDPTDFEMSKAAVLSVKSQSRLTMRDSAHAFWREIFEESYHFARHDMELSAMNQLDLLSIRTFYRQWIHSKASERRCLVISISPDPILNRLPENLHCTQHWNLEQIAKFRQEHMAALKPRTVPKEWFASVFESQSFHYPPPFFEQDFDD